MSETADTTPMSEPMRVLFLCTHNSSCAQMAEGLLCACGSDRYAVFSAEIHSCDVHPLAIQVMREIGTDIREVAGTTRNRPMNSRVSHRWTSS